MATAKRSGRALTGGIALKRAYEKAVAADGFRILVDRLWPRGLKKASAHVDLWFKDVAPSPALRRWWDHDPQRWREFRRRYFAELERRPGEVARLLELIAQGPVAFVYAAKDETYNHAAALRDFVVSGPKP